MDESTSQVAHQHACSHFPVSGDGDVPLSVNPQESRNRKMRSPRSGGNCWRVFMKIHSAVSLRSSALNTVQWVSLLRDFSEPLACKSVLSSPKEEGRECKCSPDVFVCLRLTYLGEAPARTSVEKCSSSDSRAQGSNLSPKRVSQTCLAIHPAGGKLERRPSSRRSDPVGQVTLSPDVVEEIPTSVGFQKLEGLS